MLKKSFFDNVLLKYFIYKERVVSFTEPKNKERGLVFIPFLIKAGVTLAVTAFGYYSAKGALGDTAKSFTEQIVAAIGTTLIAIAETIFNFASTFLSTVLSPSFIKGTITRNDVFLPVWTIVRDLSNMLIVLGFIVIGLATALRIADYAAKRLLFWLILIAILINFSGLFCGIIIDASNIITNDLISRGGGAGAFTEITDAVRNSANQQINNSTGAENLGAALAAQAAIAVFMVITAYVFARMAILIATRYVMLIILFILSPLAFFCFVFPPIKQYFNMWKDNFLKWSFVGVGISFFVFLSLSVLKGQTNPDIMSFFISFVFLMVGYKLSVTGGGIGAGIVTGLAGGAVALATGGVSTVAKGGLNTLKGLGDTRPANAIKSGVLGMAEKFRLVAPGTSTKNERTAVGEYKKQMDHLTKDEIDKNLSKKMVWTQGGVRQRAALAELAVEKGAFDPENKQHMAGLRQAQAKGYEIPATAIAKDPRLAGLRPNIKTPDEKQDAIATAVKNSTPKDVRSYNKKALGDFDVAKHFDVNQVAGLQKGNKEQIAAVKQFGTGGSKELEWNAEMIRMATANPNDPRVKQMEKTRDAIDALP